MDNKSNCEVDNEMLERKWSEIEFFLNIVRVTRGSHVRNLPIHSNKLGEFLQQISKTACF